MVAKIILIFKHEVHSIYYPLFSRLVSNFEGHLTLDNLQQWVLKLFELKTPL